MTFSKLATALSVIFIVSVVALVGELLYVLWRHRAFRCHASPAPHTYSQNKTTNTSIMGSTTKELMYFLCLKPRDNELDTPGSQDKYGPSLDDQAVDVFKLLDAKGPSRFLCTIKEEDREEVESTLDVDFSNKSSAKIVCLQSRLQLAGERVMEEQVAAVTVDGDGGNISTVFSTPCDSPVFFTPVGSPTRDFLKPEVVVSVIETRNWMADDRHFEG